MAPAIYPKWKQSAYAGDANSDLDNTGATTAPYCVLLRNSYTYNGAHAVVNDWTPASNISGPLGPPPGLQIGSAGTPQTLTDGLFKSTLAITFSAVTVGFTVNALGIFINNSANNTTSRLFAYIDNFTAVPTNGGDIIVTWNASGIVQL